jgi:hypothetical protein
MQSVRPTITAITGRPRVNPTELLSALVANRKDFFDLVTTLEAESFCSIDALELQGLIDANYAGRDSLTTEEARALLMQACRARPVRGTSKQD